MNPQHNIVPSPDESPRHEEVAALPSTALSLREPVVFLPEKLSPDVIPDFFLLRNGIDYIVDYFAVLGVSRDASDDDIKSKYREHASQSHPDVISRGSDKVRALADREFKLANEALEALETPEKRAAHREALESFDPALVSKDGTPIISLSQEKVSIDYLVSGLTYQPSQDEEKYLAAHVQSDDAVFALVEQQFLAGAEPGAALTKLYRDQLVQRLALLSVREGQAWRRAGVLNVAEPQQYASTDEFLEVRRDKFSEIKDSLSAVVHRRLLNGSEAGLPLLLPCEGEAVSPPPSADEIARVVLERAESRFESHRQELDDIAMARAEIMNKLLSQLSWQYLGEPRPAAARSELVILLFQNRIAAMGMSLQIAGEGKNLAAETVSLGGHISWPETKDARRNLQRLFGGRDVALVSLDPELDTVLQIGRVSESYFYSDGADRHPAVEEHHRGEGNQPSSLYTRFKAALSYLWPNRLK